jgi:hypothetical protein
MSANSLPCALKSILMKLEYLGMIERGAKPNMNDMTFVRANSWFGALYRAINHESKDNVVLHVNQIINETIAAIDEYGKTKFLANIIQSLSRARRGVSNLVDTYRDYPSIVVQLNVILVSIDLQLSSHEELLENNNDGDSVS